MKFSSPIDNSRCKSLNEISDKRAMIQEFIDDNKVSHALEDVLNYRFDIQCSCDVRVGVKCNNLFFDIKAPSYLKNEIAWEIKGQLSDGIFEEVEADFGLIWDVYSPREAPNEDRDNEVDWSNHCFDIDDAIIIPKNIDKSKWPLYSLYAEKVTYLKEQIDYHAKALVESTQEIDKSEDIDSFIDLLDRLKYIATSMEYYKILQRYILNNKI